MKKTINSTTTTFGQCSATVISYSHFDGTPPLITMELVYPRYIHSELMTHRMFSRNAMSSRATPVDVMLKEISMHPVFPHKVFKNKAGMVGGEEITNEVLKDKIIGKWFESMETALDCAKAMNDMGAHKQHINRLLEPFSFIKVIVTATDWDNFFNLRLASDAQPEIQDLARAIKSAQTEANMQAQLIKYGVISYGDVVTDNYTECVIHCPYVSMKDIEENKMNAGQVALVSSARCARVSYLTHKGKVPTYEEDIALASKLLESHHMSPFEHCAMRSNDLDENSYYYNLRGWMSYRYLFDKHIKL